LVGSVFKPATALHLPILENLMNALSDIRIGTRLAIGFAIVLMLSIISTGFALVNAQANAAATKRMMAQPLAKERTATDWYNQVNLSVARTAMLAKSADGSLATTFAPEMAEGVKKGGALAKQVEALMDTDDEKAIYRSGTGVRAKYLDAKDRVMKARQGGDAAAADQIYTDEFVPSSTAFLASMRDLVMHERKVLDDMSLDIEKSTARSFTLIVSLGLLLVALGAVCAWLISRSITVPLEAAIGIAATVASGDLTTAFTTPSRDQIGDLMRALKGMNDELAKVVGEVQVGTHAIATASSEIAAGNQDLSTRTEQQASSLEETASSMEELTSTVRQNAENARQANQLAQAASDVAVKGGAIVGQVVDTMGSINSSAKKIADIIGVIDGIAFQTNILALNAAVEAARAGEQGRGFAVVASEVRNLAQRSAGAAKEIKELIDNSVAQVDIGASLVQQAGSTMDDVVASVRRVTDMMGEITSASQEQSAGIDQVNEAITQMDQVTQQNAALVEQAAAAAESMQEQAANLARAAAGFKLDQSQLPALAEPRHQAARAAVKAPAASARMKTPLLKRPAPATKPALAAAARPAARKTPASVSNDGDWEEF
jgi:methyl-accepting chemotaxis protein